MHVAIPHKYAVPLVYFQQESEQNQPAASQGSMAEGTCSLKPILYCFKLCAHPAAGSSSVNACCNPPQIYNNNNNNNLQAFQLIVLARYLLGVPIP